MAYFGQTGYSRAWPKMTSGQKKGPGTLDEWEQYAQTPRVTTGPYPLRETPVSGTFYGKNVPDPTKWRTKLWRGGHLTAAQLSEVQNLQKKELISEYQTAYGEAKAANEARYQEVLGGYRTRYSTAMQGLAASRGEITGQLAANRAEVLGGLKGLGEEELAGIGRRYGRERASVAQQLISSGLHSTTVAPAVQGGVTRREGYAMGEARERLRREKLGYISQLGTQELTALKQLSDRDLLLQTGLTKDELDFIERREDVYPSESLYVQLMQGLGSS